ncbi:MAG: tetratricopeptide repeat protein, partial [bacterium]
QALVELLAGRADEALGLAREVVAGQAPPVSAHNTLGALLFQRGEHEAALEQFLACRAAAPEHTQALVNAVLARAALGQLDAADTLLAALPAPRPDSLAAHLAVGYLHERRERWDEAAAAYEAALRLDPAHVPALCGLGRCALAKGDLEASARHFAQAELLRPTDRRALRGLGTVHYLTGEFAEAVAVLGRLADLEDAAPRDLASLGVALLHLADRRREAAPLLDRAVGPGRQPDPYALAGMAYLAYSGLAGDREEAEALFRKANAHTEAPRVSQYAAQALRRIYVARREEFTTLTFQGERTAKLPEGWTAVGRGMPLPSIRDDALRFQGSPQAATLRQVVRDVARTTPAEDGAARTFVRFEAQVRVPMTNQAPVGISLGVGDARFQLALRTTLKPQPSRRLAWRVARGTDASAWTDLPGQVAAEQLELGLALRDGGVDVLREGRAVADGLPFPELRRATDRIEVGLFAAPDAGQRCLYTVREVEIVWKKAAPDR